MNRFIDFLMKHPNQTNAIVAGVAVCISFLSVLLTVVSLSLQRRHNFLSVRPIAAILLADYENRLSVKLHNNGVGPLLIQKLVVSDGQSARESIIDWMPNGLLWDDFAKELQGRSLASGKEIVLVKLVGDPANGNFRQARNLCRDRLKSLTVTVHYTDVYDRTMKPSRRSLSWFGRQLTTIQAPSHAMQPGSAAKA